MLEPQRISMMSVRQGSREHGRMRVDRGGVVLVGLVREQRERERRFLKSTWEREARGFLAKSREEREGRERSSCREKHIPGGSRSSPR
jgi:hypothetical protein